MSYIFFYKKIKILFLIFLNFFTLIYSFDIQNCELIWLQHNIEYQVYICTDNNSTIDNSLKNKLTDNIVNTIDPKNDTQTEYITTHVTTTNNPTTIINNPTTTTKIDTTTNNPITTTKLYYN